jgi:hypothetical protein
MTGRWVRPADDTGASLVMALALVTFLGLVIGTLLSYTATSVRATKATDNRVARTYDADGALQTAINQVRNSDFNNDPGSACPNLLVPASDGSTTTVTCTAAAGSGGTSERVLINTTNTPKQGVLALGVNVGETGIAQQSASTFRVQGKILSNGSVTAGTGTVESANATVTVRGTCTGTVISRDALGKVVPNVCAATTAVVADPSYVAPTVGLTYRALPSCDATSTVEFLPGYYDDAVGLSAMMDGTGACAGKTFLFQSAAGGAGTYYFDFHNGEGGGLPAGPRVWTINDRTAEVVGGTPQGWVPDASVPAIPGSCVSPLRGTANNGVQFLFGGDSRIKLTAGAVELCGQYSLSAPPVAIYGAKAGADTITAPAALTTNGLGTNPTTGPAFSTPANIVTTNNVVSSAVVDSTAVLGGVTASVVVDGYVPLASAPIPAGSVLTTANLVVVHRENTVGATGKLQLLQVSVTPTRTGAPALVGVPQPTIYQDGALTTNHTDTLNLLPSLSAEVHANGFVGMKVRYDAGAAFLNKVTENLDSIQLTLKYKKPAVRGEKIVVPGSTANCVGLYPAGCPLLETDAGGDAVLAVQGTVYVPYATVNLRLSNAPGAVIRSGLIARAIQAQVTNAAAYPGPVVEVPSSSAGPIQLVVYFRALVTGKAVPVATAKVHFPAEDPTIPPPPGRRNINILSWTVRRN